MARTPAKNTRTVKASSRKAASRKTSRTKAATKTTAKPSIARQSVLPAVRTATSLPVMPNAARAQQMLGRMLNRKLYVAISTGHCTLEQLQVYLTEHLEYMVLLEKKGLLFSSGPLKGGAIGDGLTIYNTRTMRHAQRLAEQDPFVRHGLREFELREWTLMEGAVNLTINLSDRSVDLPPAELDPYIG